MVLEKVKDDGVYYIQLSGLKHIHDLICPGSSPWDDPNRLLDPGDDPKGFFAPLNSMRMYGVDKHAYLQILSQIRILKKCPKRSIPKRLQRMFAKDSDPAGFVCVGKSSPYAIPFRVGPHYASREKAVRKVREYRDTHPEFVQMVKQDLNFFDLVCSYAHALLELASERP
jgi:hypothetical protein